MLKKDSGNNVRLPERRKHWRDRRSTADRRNSSRLHLANFECREGIPRRCSDVSGDLTEGEVWWDNAAKYE